ARVAGAASARTVLGSRELIINGSGIALRPGGLLIDQRLDSGHDRRRKRRATRARPRARVAAAGRSAIRRIGPAKYIVVTPQAIRGEQRDVWSVAHAVVRIAENRLPRGLRPSCTGSAYNTGSGWRTAGALTGTPTPRYGALNEGTERSVI